MRLPWLLVCGVWLFAAMAQFHSWAGAVPGGCCPPDQLGLKHNVALRDKFSLLWEKSAWRLYPSSPDPNTPTHKLLY